MKVLLLLASPPIARPSPVMRDGRDGHVVLIEPIHYRVRKPGDSMRPGLAEARRTCRGMLGDAMKCRLDLVEELVAEAGLLEVVEVCRFEHLVPGSGIEPYGETHSRAARA